METFRQTARLNWARKCPPSRTTPELSTNAAHAHCGSPYALRDLALSHDASRTCAVPVLTRRIPPHIHEQVNSHRRPPLHHKDFEGEQIKAEHNSHLDHASYQADTQLQLTPYRA